MAIAAAAVPFSFFFPNRRSFFYAMMSLTETSHESRMQSLRAATCMQADRALPFWSFHDRGLFELELRRTFYRDWVYACPAHQLRAPNSYVATSIGGEPVIIVRDGDGTLRALSNVCRHRGTRLAQGTGTATTFECPYHAWRYAQSGALMGAPFSKGAKLDKSDHCLPTFRAEIWAGLVFVCLSANTPPLAQRMGALNEHFQLSEADLEDTEAGVEEESWAANWKLAIENAMESYHLFKVHPQTLEPDTPTKRAFYVDGGPQWSLTSGYGPDKHDQDEAYWLVSIPPSFVGVFTQQSLLWLAVEPLAPDQTLIRSGYWYPRSGHPWWSMQGLSDLYDGSRAAIVGKRFMAEDKQIVEAVHAGTRSRLSDGGQLVPLERIVSDFHAYLGTRLFTAA